MSIISFYLGQTPDHAGRKITDIWAFSHDELEHHHDFIQWLFPLEVPSPVNPAAPTLTPEDRRQFGANAQLQTNLLKSLDLMLDFYGLEREGTHVRRSTDFPDRSENWINAGNHNHLRLTRIVHCLALCGRKVEAKALLACLLEIAKENPRAISARTVEFWRHAVVV
jgi:hypothetical protein